MPASTIAFEKPELLEQQLSELSARFVSLTPDQVDHQIDWGLKLLLEAMGLGRSSIAEISADGQRMEVTHSQASADAPPMPKGDLTVALPWYAALIRRGEMLRLERIPDDFPPEATAEREYCVKVGMRSQLTIPFMVGDRVIGAIGFSSFRREVQWTPHVVRSLRLISEVFANALARKQAADQEVKLREQLAHSARVNAMGEVVASVAHEVNQPLFAIVTNARAAGQLLSRPVPDLAEIGAALEDIVQDANRASATIARIRSFLQRRPTEHLPVDVNGLVETVTNFLGAEMTRRGVKLARVLGESVPVVQGDGVQLQQVLVNLLMNAADAMEGIDPTQRVIDIQTVAEGGDRWIRIDVGDQGPGLDPGTRRRLFEAFFTTKPNGLGMGLAIARSIVEAHGGRIQPLERAGPGTTMQVWLPIRRV
ncbi:MAG TPA: ATP-binding protein [Thermoanaerobaculaceae bacterium]|nr:ATP-binding protein [Thermoanaerobaculaceae bacterium]